MPCLPLTNALRAAQMLFQYRVDQQSTPPAEAQEQPSNAGRNSHQQQPPEQLEVTEQQGGAVQDAGHLDVAPATSRYGLGANFAGTTLIELWRPKRFNSGRPQQSLGSRC